MLSAIAHAAAIVIAAGITFTLIKTALAVPAWWMSLMISGLMMIPVGLLSWADAPRWVIPLPLVAILGVLAFTLSVLAGQQYERLRHLRNERDTATATLGRHKSPEEQSPDAAEPQTPAGWWDAPTSEAPATATHEAVDVVAESSADESAHDTGPGSTDRNVDDDNREFADMMRRNFTA